MNEWTIPAILIGILSGQTLGVLILIIEATIEGRKRKSLPPISNYTSDFKWK